MVYETVLRELVTINEIEWSIIIWKNSLNDITNFIVFIVAEIKFCFNAIIF